MRTDSIRRNDNFPVLVSLAVALGILVGAVAVLSIAHQTWANQSGPLQNVQATQLNTFCFG